MQLGEGYLEAGLWYDAAEFFRKASYSQGLEKVRALALEEGDSFLFALATKGDSDDKNRSGWQELGRKAMDLRKYSHAIRAFQKSGDESMLEQARESFKGISS